MSKTRSFLLGFVVGGAISATVTLLSAPSSGRDLRQKIAQQSSEWKQIIDEMIQKGLNLKDQIARTSKEGVSLINELTTEMKKSIDEWKMAIEPHQESIHEYLEQLEASIRDLESKIEIQKKKQAQSDVSGNNATESEDENANN